MSDTLQMRHNFIFKILGGVQVINPKMGKFGVTSSINKTAMSKAVENKKNMKYKKRYISVKQKFIGTKTEETLLGATTCTNIVYSFFYYYYLVM